jgi:hypothetical protein
MYLESIAYMEAWVEMCRDRSRDTTINLKKAKSID